jgi:hypothetical protein
MSLSHLARNGVQIHVTQRRRPSPGRRRSSGTGSSSSPVAPRASTVTWRPKRVPWPGLRATSRTCRPRPPIHDGRPPPAVAGELPTSGRFVLRDGNRGSGPQVVPPRAGSHGRADLAGVESPSLGGGLRAMTGEYLCSVWNTRRVDGSTGTGLRSPKSRLPTWPNVDLEEGPPVYD